MNLKRLLAVPYKKYVRCIYKTRTLFNEVLLNIETEPSASGPGALQDGPELRGIYTDQAVHNDNTYYEPIDYRLIGPIIRALSLGSNDVFYDIGCGKGRVLCVAARLRLKKVVGIELFEELCTTARQNAECLRGKKSPIEVICTDATKAGYSDGTAFYLWNPFGEKTMRSVIKSIRESFLKSSRNIRIVYCNPLHEDVFAQEPWLERYANLKLSGAPEISFWRSRTR